MLLRPDLMVNTVSDLKPAMLKQHGIRGVMVDLDDTLVASGSTMLAEGFRTWVHVLKTHHIPILILSNGRLDRVKKWSLELDIDGFALVGKPLGFAFRRGLKILGTKTHETAMVGDQLFTDILGANAAGLTSILVKPLSAGGLPHTRLARYLEKLILKGGYGGRSFNR